MNGIEASERLRELNSVLPYIENAADMADDDREEDSAGALRKLLGQLLKERDILHAKLSEVQL